MWQRAIGSDTWDLYGNGGETPSMTCLLERIPEEDHFLCDFNQVAVHILKYMCYKGILVAFEHGKIAKPQTKMEKSLAYRMSVLTQSCDEKGGKRGVS